MLRQVRDEYFILDSIPDMVQGFMPQHHGFYDAVKSSTWLSDVHTRGEKYRVSFDPDWVHHAMNERLEAARRKVDEDSSDDA